MTLIRERIGKPVNRDIGESEGQSGVESYKRFRILVEAQGEGAWRLPKLPKLVIAKIENQKHNPYR
jgi:hypothetical protein